MSRSTRSRRGALGGSTEGLIPARIADASREARIGRHIEPQANGCWLYNGDAANYRSVPGVGAVHRWVYETLVGPIDEGCHVHHTCESPGCCNPAHLVVLTPKEHAAAHKAIRKSA